MEQSNANENIEEEIEIEPFQNEILMDDIPITKTSIKILSLEIEASKACESNNEIFILNLQKLHAQRLFWEPKRRNAICWVFYVVNDNKSVDGKVPHVMKCNLCYKTPMLYHPRTKLRKGDINFEKTCGCMTQSTCKKI
jgi:hypothetical protein